LWDKLRTMSYKVYIFDKAINITDNLNESTAHVYAFSSVDLDDIITKLQANILPEVYLYHPNLQEAWEIFKTHFDVIEAAGGIVQNDEKNTCLSTEMVNGTCQKEKWSRVKSRTKRLLEKSRKNVAYRISALTISYWILIIYSLKIKRNGLKSRIGLK